MSADKGYVRNRNLEAIEAVGAVPYIPFKSNNRGEGPAASAVSDLTAKELDNMRAALRFLHAKVGKWTTLTKALRTTARSLRRTRDGESATPALAVRVAKFAGVGVDDVLAGRFPPPSTCPMCGHITS